VTRTLTLSVPPVIAPFICLYPPNEALLTQWPHASSKVLILPLGWVPKIRLTLNVRTEYNPTGKDISPKHSDTPEGKTLGLTIDELEQRIHQGWEKCPAPRPYITIKRETYLKLKAEAVFVDAEFGEWEATPDGVMRGGMHPKRRQKDYTKVTCSKEELYDLYINQNIPLKEIAKAFNCHYVKVLRKLREFKLKKPMALKQKLMVATSMERYGVEHPMQSAEIAKRAADGRDEESYKRSKENCKKTMLERYGVEHGLHHKDIRERRKKTMVERYGSEHALRADSCKEKYRQTIRDKYDDQSLEWSGYGVAEIREKITATNRANFGVDFPFQSSEIQEKVKKTFIKKYGVDRIAKCPEIQEKIRKSILKRFGIHHLSLPEMRERIKQTSLERYGFVCSLQNEQVQEKSYETRIKNDSFKTSALEKEIRDFVDSIVSCEVTRNIRTIIAPYEIDILIPDKKIAIEVNGLYWHSEAWVDKTYHAMKYTRCKDAGYRLVTIFEHEWYERKTAVMGRLRAVLGGSTISIGARETEFSVATKEEATAFLNEFHVQGSTRFEKAFKLTFGTEILALMTFGRHHRQTSKELVLSRFCVRDNHNVKGAASKLLKNADIREPLVSYSDNRWSDGDLYQQLKFQLDGQMPPDYFYISNAGVFSKQSLKKTKIERESGRSEHELRLAQGYLRVYDCGKLRWLKTPIY